MNLKKYLLILILLSLHLSNCTIERLDEVKKAAEKEKFDPAEYAQNFWTEKLMKNLDSAVDASVLFQAIKKGPEEARNKYALSLGMSSIYNYFITGKGWIVSIDEDGIGIALSRDGLNADITIAIIDIFGNAVRDAAGLIDLNEFVNIQDFNDISIEINKIVTSKVIPPFKEKVRTGMNVKFVGCAEIMNEETDLSPLLIIPVYLEFL